MSVDATLSQEIFNTMVAYFDGYLNAQFQQLMKSFSPLFRGILVIYTIIIGYKMASNNGDSWLEIIKPYIYVLVVYTCVLETSLYKDYIVNPFLDSVNDLSVFFANGEANQIFSALDTQALAFIKATGKVWPSSLNPIDHIIAFFAFTIIYFVFFTMFFAFLAIYCISYFSMCMFFLVGGIFILFGCLKPTRGLFFAWLKNLFQFALTIVFASITLGLSFNGIKASIGRINQLDISNIFTFDYLSLVAWCVITIALFLKSPDFAAGLTSTMAGSTAGIAGAMSAAGGATAGGVAAATGGAASGAVGAGAWGWNNRKDIGGGLKNLGGSATAALKNKLGIK